MDVFENNIARVQYEELENRIFTVNIALLARAVECQRDFCVNDRVMDHEYALGTITEVFTNDRARVWYEHLQKYYHVAISLLGKGVRCHANICRHDKVMDHESYVGRVKEVFTNGRAWVWYPSLQQSFTVPTSLLSKRVD